MGRIWKFVGYNFPAYDAKIRRSLYEIPKIEKYNQRGNFPLIRVNAFPVQQMPYDCLTITLKAQLTTTEFRDKIINAYSPAITVQAKSILAWGNDDDIRKIFPDDEIKSKRVISLEPFINKFNSNTQLIAFYARALARSLVNDKPLKLRKHHNRYYVVIQAKEPAFVPFSSILKDALKVWDYNAKKALPATVLAGKVPKISDTYWMECVEISLEYIDGKFWIIIVPEIWIEPKENRSQAIEFLKLKKKARYNSTQSSLLDAWSKILFGEGNVVSVSPFKEGTSNNPIFKIVNKTAYSFKTT